MDSPSSPSPEASESSRLLAIYRRWLRAQRLRSVWAWHRLTQPGEKVFGFLSVAVFLFIPVDEALWRYRGPFPWTVLAPRSGTALAVVFLCVCATNGILLHVYLSRRTADEKDWPLGLLALRAFAGGLPLLGLHLVPFWLRLPEKSSKPAQDTVSEGDLEGRTRSVLGWARWTDLAEAPWLLPWMFGSGFAVLLVGGCWLAKQATLNPGGYIRLALFSVALHLIIFTALRAPFRKEATHQRLPGWSSFTFKVLPILWLLPVPYLPLLAMLLQLMFDRESASWKCVISRVWVRDKEAGRLSFWLRLEDRLLLAWSAVSSRQRWRSPPHKIDRGIEVGREERQILRLYDLASYSLGFDAAALAWALVWWAGRHPDWSRGLTRTLWTVLAASIILLAAGLCAGAAHLFLLLLRSPGRLRVLDRHPYATYLAKTQLCLLWGWFMGMVLWTSSSEDAARLLVATGMLLIVLKSISLVLRPTLPHVRSHQQRIDAFPGVALLFVLIILRSVRSRDRPPGSCVGRLGASLSDSCPAARTVSGALAAAAFRVEGSLRIPRPRASADSSCHPCSSRRGAVRRPRQYRFGSSCGTGSGPGPRHSGGKGRGMLSFRENYQLRYLAHHAHEAGSWELLFEQIEVRDLLVRQAKQFKGFAQSTRDLEEHVLPGTIILEDWDRFIRYSLVAVNLRGLAEALVEEEVLRALAHQDQIELARSLVEQLPDPGRRVAAYAILADETKDADFRSQLLQEVQDDLRALPTSDEENSAAMLETVARHLGPELERDWASLVARFDEKPGLKSRLWLALADGCRKRGWGHSGVSRALREVRDSSLVPKSLRGWLREGAVPEPAILREICRELADPDRLLLWMAFLTTLVERNELTPDEAWESWEEQTRQKPAVPVPWTRFLVENGASLFAGVTPSQADRIAAGLENPVLQAAFRVVRLEKTPDEERTQKALAAVRFLQVWEARLHWTLRLLSCWQGDPDERERLAAGVAYALRERRYVAPAEDLRRFLDLAAEVFPRELPRLVGIVMRAPESRPETLTAIVETSQSPAVLEKLFEEVEAYALIVSPTEAEGFELRARLIVRLACRLCREKKDHKLQEKVLEEAASRLLPEEQDSLYVAAARELADLAPELITKIRSSRLKTATSLAVLGVASGEKGFDPRLLYESVAVVEAAEEEHLALDLLAEPALDPESLIEGPLASMNSKERQGQALIDLARAALELDENLFEKGQRDPLVPLQLVRHSLSAVGSDERLAALTLELLDLAQYMEGPRAVAEFHEAVDVLALRLESLPWPARRDALEILLARIQPVLLGRLEEMGHRKATVRCRGVAELIDAILDLPARADDGPGRKALREGWHEILPAIFAAVERLPRLARVFLTHPCRAWLWAQVLPELSQLFGGERMWRALGILEMAAPRGLRERFRSHWATGEAGAFAKSWSWLTLEQTEVLELCLAGPEAWKKEAADLSSSPVPSPQRLQTLTRLLSVTEPEWVPGLVARLPEGSERDDVCVRLIRGSWLSTQSADLLSYISGAARRLEAEVFGAGDLKDESWARDLGELAGRHGLDPSHPKAWPALRRLRAVASGETSKALAESLAGSLLEGGKEGGERAFRVWLNSHLFSRIGQDERKKRSAQVREEISKALVFPSVRESKTQGESDVAPAEALLEEEVPQRIRKGLPRPQGSARGRAGS